MFHSRDSPRLLVCDTGLYLEQNDIGFIIVAICVGYISKYPGLEGGFLLLAQSQSWEMNVENENVIYCKTMYLTGDTRPESCTNPPLLVPALLHPYRHRKVVRMTALLVSGDVKGKLQRTQWQSGQSHWQPLRCCVLTCTIVPPMWPPPQGLTSISNGFSTGQRRPDGRAPQGQTTVLGSWRLPIQHLWWREVGN